jgi:cation diffusion facilitator CzcD-associated flavoprotein CzcO
VQDNIEYTCKYCVSCCGYYSYESGYTPALAGMSHFQGTMIHSQDWKEGFTCENKRVVVIGSGATAVTMLPSLAKQAKHVTILQRSPTYIMSIPSKRDLNSWFWWIIVLIIGYANVFQVIKYWDIFFGMFGYWFATTFPAKAKSYFLKAMKQSFTSAGSDASKFDAHFMPSYNPWEQRVCGCPDSDFYHAIAQKNVSIVTDKIDTFTPQGVLTATTKELISADVVILATGLNVLPFGGLKILVDNVPVDASKLRLYKGILDIFSQVDCFFFFSKFQLILAFVLWCCFIIAIVFSMVGVTNNFKFCILYLFNIIHIHSL